MSRHTALAVLALVALAPSRARAQIMDGLEPRQPESVPTGRYGFAASMVLRIPSGPGVDVAYRPWKRLEIGAEISSWLAVSEVGAYARGAFVTEGDSSLTLGARFHAIAVLAAEAEGSPASKLASVELGFTHRMGVTFWGIEVAKAAWVDGAWASDRSIGVTAEFRYGAVW
jgi:hypothetical protein